MFPCFNASRLRCLSSFSFESQQSVAHAESACHARTGLAAVGVPAVSSRISDCVIRVRPKPGWRGSAPSSLRGMERLWQKMWDWFGPRYSWAVYAFCVLASMPALSLAPFLVVAFEKSGAYLEAAGVTFVAALVTCYVYIRPGHRNIRAAERSASGVQVDRAKALEDTYTYGRRAVVRASFANIVCGVALLVVVGAITGATHSRLLQYGIIGVAQGVTIPLIGGHSFIEAALRPASGVSRK